MAPRRSRRRLWWGAVGLVTLVAAALRWHDLAGESLWLDEAVTWARTLSGPWSIVEQSALHDKHPPLYYLLVDAWTALAGTSETALRAPSLVFSLATIPVIYVLGRDLFDRSAGLLAGLVFALSDFQILYAQEARMYAMVGFLAAAAALAHHRLNARGPSRGRLAAYLAAATLLVYTHVLGWLVVGALWAHGLLALWLPDGSAWRPRHWAGTQAAVCLAFVPWAIPLVKATSGVASGFWVEDVALMDLWGTLTTFAGNVELASAMGVLALVALTARDPGHAEPSGDLWRDRGLLIVWLLAPPIALYILSKVVEPIYLDRYLIGASPALYLLAARGATVLDGRAARAVLVGVLLVGGGFTAHASLEDDTVEGWKGAVGVINNEGRAGEPVVFEAPYTQLPFDYYARTPLDKRGYQGTHWLVQDQAPFNDTGDLSSGTDRVWVVLAHTEASRLEPLADDPAFERARTWEQFPGIVVQRWER